MPEDAFTETLRDIVMRDQMVIYHAACELVDRRELDRIFGVPSPPEEDATIDRNRK